VVSGELSAGRAKSILAFHDIAITPGPCFVALMVCYRLVSSASDLR
jgi:hypothetical protein